MNGMLIDMFDIIGTVAFALSGTMVGIRKRMDIFGVCVLGVVTAVGGGMTRDIILGINPPRAFSDSRDVLIATASSLIMFLIVYFLNAKKDRKSTALNKEIYNWMLFSMDTLGLGTFTVIGIQVAITKFPDAGGFLLVFVGVITGVGGGLLRDMMSGNVPYIFQKHIYATACIIGAVVCVLLQNIISLDTAMAAGALTVMLIRLLAAVFRWDLPKIRLNQDIDIK